MYVTSRQGSSRQVPVWHINTCGPSAVLNKRAILYYVGERPVEGSNNLMMHEKNARPRDKKKYADIFKNARDATAVSSRQKKMATDFAERLIDNLNQNFNRPTGKPTLGLVIDEEDEGSLKAYAYYQNLYSVVRYDATELFENSEKSEDISCLGLDILGSEGEHLLYIICKEGFAGEMCEGVDRTIAELSKLMSKSVDPQYRKSGPA